MKALKFAAAAAIALAPFSVLVTTPVVAQAVPCADVGADPEGCQSPVFSAAQHRTSTDPALPTTVTPAQTPQVVPPSPPPPSAIPVVAAYEEPTQPAWQSALRYGVLVIAVGLVAWRVGLSLHRAVGTHAIPPGPQPHRAQPCGALAVRSTLTLPTIDRRGAEVKRLALVEAGHRCAIPTCRRPTTEIADIVPESGSHDDSFENLIALCPDCHTRYEHKNEIDRQSIRIYKRNVGILNSRYSDFERRLFDQIAETDQRSFPVEASFDILLLHAVKDGLLKRVELSPVAIQRGEPTNHEYEVTDAGLSFVNRYIQGEDIT